jgi:hypothetical protein
MMDRHFDAFVIFAEMRTGSNHLEQSLDALGDVTCHGEVFNPVFIGARDRTRHLGYDMAARERDPLGLLAALRAASGDIAGFRYFHDHDPRVLGPVLADPRIAKVLLTRNPLDAYVSREIAARTGQWRLTDLRHARSGRIRFDGEAFAEMLDRWAAFRDRLRAGLQRAGQAAFHIRYEDINDLEVLNGLAAYLGSRHRLSAVPSRLKRQNPGGARTKVENPDEMEAALARIDRFGLDPLVEGGVPRAPGVSRLVAHPDAGLLFVPVPGAPDAAVTDWLADLGGVGPEGLLRRMTQKELRGWMRAHAGFTSFSILRHPVPRAFAAYRRLGTPGAARLMQVLQDRHGVPPPGDAPDAAAFLAFAAFLKANLAGQTGIVTEGDWATQMSTLQGAAHVLLPQRILREEDAPAELAALARRHGIEAHATFREDSAADALAGLHSAEVEAAIRDVYRRDYVHFGFGAWPGPRTGG